MRRYPSPHTHCRIPTWSRHELGWGEWSNSEFYMLYWMGYSNNEQGLHLQIQETITSDWAKCHSPDGFYPRKNFPYWIRCNGMREKLKCFVPVCVSITSIVAGPGPCGSYYDCKMLCAITIRKLWWGQGRENVYYLQVQESTQNTWDHTARSQ